MLCMIENFYENKDKLSTFKQPVEAILKKKEIEDYFNQSNNRVIKNEDEAISTLREVEKDLDKKKHSKSLHAEIWCSCCFSISQSLYGKEIQGQSFEKRSEFFYHIKKFKASLHDIEKALKIVTTSTILVKLYCRKTECLIALGEKLDDSLSKAESELNKIKNKVSKNNLKVLVAKVQEASNAYVFKDHVKTNKNTEHLEALNIKEAEDFNQSVIIRFNENKGRHLVAARNFKAGDIIYVQTPYISNSSIEFLPFGYCCHCLKVTWESIPCEKDGWSFFCSEECREDAMQKYHNIECPVWARVKHQANEKFLRQLTIRTVITAIREAGSIEKLREEIKEIDECTDNCTRGFFSKNGKIETNKFKSLYSLSGQLLTEMSAVSLTDAVKTLFAFIRHSSLFGEQRKFKSVDEIRNDEDALFIGALIYKLFSIYNLNYQEIAEKSPRCTSNHDPKSCWVLRCCYRASCMSPLFSLINHSCDPNAAIMLTDNGKLMLYALKPIKKNSEILQSYTGVGTFYSKSKIHRQVMTKMAYKFKCKCEACGHDWPLLENMKKKVIYKGITTELFKKYNSLVESVETKKISFDQALATELGKAIDSLISENSESSPLICRLMEALIKVYDKMYLTRLNMPKHCDNNP